MAVRVQVQLQSQLPGRPAPAVQTAAVLNSGYEAGAPELILPFSAAQLLGVTLSTPGLRAVTYGAIGGAVQLHRLAGGASAQVVAPDRSSAVVPCDVVVSSTDQEVILSDALCEALGVAIVGFKAGVWCFVDELGKRARPSVPSQLW